MGARAIFEIVRYTAKRRGRCTLSRRFRDCRNRYAGVPIRRGAALLLAFLARNRMHLGPPRNYRADIRGFICPTGRPRHACNTEPCNRAFTHCRHRTDHRTRCTWTALASHIPNRLLKSAGAIVLYRPAPLQRPPRIPFGCRAGCNDRPKNRPHRHRHRQPHRSPIRRP